MKTNKKINTAKIIFNTLKKIREEKPLIHNITNLVAMNDIANIILAVGALPIMAHAKEEVEEMVKSADALVLNIGTLTQEQIEPMIIAGKAGNIAGIPVILDQNSSQFSSL